MNELFKTSMVTVPIVLQKKVKTSAKVLVVEDEIQTAEIFLEFLTSKGYDVQVAYDTSSAIDLINGYKPNVILIDTMLAGINNVDAATKLILQGNDNHIPVIIMTESNVFPEDDTLLGITGMHRILVKPCNPKTLLVNIEDALSYGHKMELQNLNCKS